MAAVLSDVGEIIRPVCRPYEESKMAYEVFGCDFLVTTDLNVVLMEINQRVGFFCIPNDPYPTKYETFTRNYYTFVFENAIMPLLGPEMPPRMTEPEPKKEKEDKEGVIDTVTVTDAESNPKSD